MIKTFFPDLFIALLIEVLALLIGLKIFRRFLNWKFPTKPTEFFFSLGLGLFILFYLTLGLGFLGLLYQYLFISIFVFLIIILLPEMKHLTTEFKLDLHLKGKIHTKFAYFLIAVLALAIFSNLVFNYAPATNCREMNYDLSVPRMYVRYHRIIDIPDNFTSYYPLGIQMLYTLAMTINDSLSPKLINYFFGILNMFLIYFFVKEFIGKEKIALLSSAIFYLMPVVTEFSGTANIDLGYLFYGLLSIWALIEWIKSNQEKWFYLAALLTGICLTTKIIAVSVLLANFIFILYWRIFVKKEHFSSVVRKCLLFLTICFVIYSPWLLRNYFFTGNPLQPFPFPFLNLPGHEHSMTEIFTLRIMKSRYTFLDYLKFHNNLLFGEFIHGCGPLLWSFIIPFFLLSNLNLSKRTKVIVLLAFIQFFCLYFLLPVSRHRFFETRYYIVSYALFSIVAACGIEKTKSAFFNSTIVNLLVIGTLVFPCLSLTFYLGAKRIPLFLGFQSKEEYIQKYIPHYRLIEYANQKLYSTDRVMYIGCMTFQYYWKIDTVTPSLGILRETNINKVISKLKEDRITHILFFKKSFRPSKNGTYIDPSGIFHLHWKIEDYVGKYFDLVQAEDGVYLYKIK